MVERILDKLDKKVRDIMGYECKRYVEKDNVVVGVHGKLRDARLCVDCDTVFFKGNECPSCSGKQVLLKISKWLGGELGEQNYRRYRSNNNGKAKK